MTRRIVLLGAMAQMPFAGVAWQVLHYLEGLRRLGHHVTYLEDTGNWPYDPQRDTVTDDAAPAVRRLRRVLEQAGLAERWAYVNAARDGETWGMTSGAVRRELSRADVLINLSGATVLREAHLGVPVRIYLETDPVTPQIEIANGNRFTLDLLAAHTHHFTFGERLGRPGCDVPVGPFRYRPTRQPVVLDWWAPPPGSAPSAGPLRFTTVANWEQGHKDIHWAGEAYTWSKSAEFLKLLELPRSLPDDLVIELALALEDAATIALLERHGWRVVPALALSRAPDAYRGYIQGSTGEFTVAKDQNVRLRSGWFSDRTATYLAAGRPAVVQDTGFDVALPTGEGLFAFRGLEDAAAGLQAVAGDYDRHSRAALDLADAHFRAEDVLRRLLDQAEA
ncbi:MAG TPA: hypothetical protein VFR49_03060 [Solirubrobacteraceae bacterium]|nr:hypothetical protein [Solirubrobacteraceae bacterium]